MLCTNPAAGVGAAVMIMKGICGTLWLNCFTVVVSEDPTYTQICHSGQRTNNKIYSHITGYVKKFKSGYKKVEDSAAEYLSRLYTVTVPI